MLCIGKVFRIESMRRIRKDLHDKQREKERSDDIEERLQDQEAYQASLNNIHTDASHR